MTHRVRSAALAAALALGAWLVAAADSRTAETQGAKAGPYNDDIAQLAEGKGSADAIAKKAELGDVMQAFKPRSKGGLGVGPTPDAIKPDGIELKFIALGKAKSVNKADLAKQGDALAKAADETRAIADVAILYTEKDGKKNPAKWKQYAEDMRTAAGELANAARKHDAKAVKQAVEKVNGSCVSCHADFRD